MTKIFLKKILSPLLFLTIIFSLFNCTSENPPSNQGDSNANSHKTNLNNFNVEYVSHKYFYDGTSSNHFLIVKYKFTHYYDEASSFSYSVNDELFQNGLEVLSYPDLLNILNYDNSTQKVKPGVTVEIERLYKLNDGSTPVTIELSEAYSNSSDVVIKTINLP